MSISRFDSWSRISGTLSFFWVAFYSKYLSLGDSGDLAGLLTVLLPLLITHWFVRKSSYSNPSPAAAALLSFPLIGVSLAMMVSSLINNQPILHEQGPSLWIYALTATLLFRLWRFEFITTICAQAFVCYGAYFLIVQIPAVQTPGSGTLRHLYENPNILGMYLASFFLLSKFSLKSTLVPPFSIAVLITLVYCGSVFGTWSFLSSLVVLAGYEKLLLCALICFSIGALIFKLFFLGHSDAVEVRLEIWHEAIKQGLQSPFFGAGHNHKIFIELRPGSRIDHPHNFLLQIFRVSGAFGLFMISWLLGSLVLSWQKLAVNQRAFLTFFLFWSLADDWFVWHGSILLFAAGSTVYGDEPIRP